MRIQETSIPHFILYIFKITYNFKIKSVKSTRTLAIHVDYSYHTEFLKTYHMKHK